MPIRVRRVRRLDLPWIGISIFGVWAGVVALLYLAGRDRSDMPPLCLLRRTTGVPCPTCGGTRAAFRLIEFRPLDALAANPLVTITLVVGVSYLIIRTLSARGLAIEWSRRSRLAAWAAFAAAVLATWAWVIVREMG